MVTMYQGDCREILRELPDESVHCCVTSPPYWGLRDYGTAKWEGGREDCDHIETANLKRDCSGGVGGGRDKGTRGEQPSSSASVIQFRGRCGKCGAKRIDAQIGLEKTPEEYVAQLVAVFREVKRVLRKDATLWLNLGDSYNGSGQKDTQLNSPKQMTNRGGNTQRGTDAPGLKPKDLCGIPWLVAFALRADGWYLRQDIIWAKPNPMPESVTDRCTKAHEYIFLLSKSATYFYDGDKIKEEAAYDGRQVTTCTDVKRQGSELMWAGSHERWPTNGDGEYVRNKRSVWDVATKPFPEAHFATFPPELIKPCILAGCPSNGIVLDPFFGAGTTGLVSGALNCQCIGIELNQEYLEIAAKRLSQSVFQFSPETEIEPELQQSLLGPDEEKKRIL